MELKGKQLTLWAKVSGALIAVVGLGLKATIAPGLPIDDVLKVAGFVVVVFSTIDVSLIAGNIFNTRRRGAGEMER
jgi:hypothetical protein